MPKRTANEERRLKELRAEMVAIVLEYFTTFQAPMPLYRLSQRFHRSLAYYGSNFRTELNALRDAGMVQTCLTERATYEVTPGLNAWVSPDALKAGS